MTAARRAVPELVERLAGTEGLLLGLDFDGTLAPVADDPSTPVIEPACRQALAQFVASGDATVAVISGRAVRDVRARVGLDGVVYGGNHGLEFLRRDRYAVHPAARRGRPALRRVLERVTDRLATVPGWHLEDKWLTATVHVQDVPGARVDDVRSAVASSVRADRSGLTVSTGIESIEIRPAVDWDKGDAIASVARTCPAGWATAFLGDDETDEDAFRTDRPPVFGVLVGSRPETAAAYQLPDQGAVAPFLTRLAAARRDAQSRPGR